MAITLTGNQAGAGYTSDLNDILRNLNRHYSSGTAPTGDVLEEGLIWHDTTADRLKIYDNGSFITLPFNTADGNIVSSGIASISFGSLSSFTDTNIADGVQQDDESLATAKAIKDYVDSFNAPTTGTATIDRALIRTEFAAEDTIIQDDVDANELFGDTDRALIRTEFASADSTHAMDTSTHGVGTIVGTTETQGLSNKAITAGTNSATTIDGVIIGGTTRAAGSFTQLEIGSTITDVGGTITGGASSITINPDPTSTTGEVVIAGDLTVNGTTTTINSTVQSHADKDIILAADATDNTGVTGAGLLLGTPTQESWLYNGTNWAASAPIRAEAYDVGTTNIIDTSGNWVNRANSIPVTSLDGTVGNTNLADATTTTKGIASFSSDNFAVTAGEVTIKNDGVILGTETTGNFVNDVAQATTNNGLNVSHTASEGSTATISNSLATTSTVGTASFSSNDFGVTAGAVTIKTDGVAPGTQIAGGDLATDVKVNTDNFDAGTDKQLDVGKGGTGLNTVTADRLLRGNNANDLVETIIGDGLELSTNDLQVKPSDIGVEEFNNIPGTFGTVGQALVVNSAQDALEYSTSVVDITAVQNWARVTGGGGQSTTTNQVLVHTGTSGTAGYAWADLSGLTTASPTGDLSVSSVTTTGNTSVGGNLSVNGNTTIGNAATDTTTLNGLVSYGGSVNSDVLPNADGTRDLGSTALRWAEVHTDTLEMGGNSFNDIETDGSTFTSSDTAIPTTKAVRDYVGSTEAGGSIIVITTAKTIPVGTIAIVTLGSVTKLWTADSTQTGVVLNTFSTTNGGTEFKETVTGFTELRTGASAGSVTIDNFTVTSGQRTSGNLTLSTSVSNENSISVFIDGVYQEKDVYTVSTTTLAFGANELPVGAKVEVIIGSVVNFDGGTLGDITATGTIIAPNIGNASTTLLGNGANITGIAGSGHTHDTRYARFDAAQSLTAANKTQIRSNITVDEAGTDNSTNVTLAGTRDYLTISGQAITRNEIDIADDTNLAAGTGISLSGSTLNVGYGTATGTACEGNDSRLSDARTPVAHNQAFSTITSTPTTLSGYGITDASGSGHNHEGTYTEPLAGTASSEGFRFGTSGSGSSKQLTMVYRNGSGTDVTVAAINVSDILSGFPIDSWTT